MLGSESENADGEKDDDNDYDDDNNDDDNDDDEDIDVDFFATGTICCIAADPDDNNNNRNPFYFFYVNEVDLTAEFDTADDYNHKIKAGQSYLSGHYLEGITHKTKKGGYLYYVDDNKTVCF